MSNAAGAWPGTTVQPFFLDVTDRKILLTLTCPTEGQPGDFVLLLPPFAEEMNKSRRMMALMGRRLAARGMAAVLPDLTGTGDSDLDFSAADYATWREDVAACADWIAGRGRLRAIVGVRFGALLAADLARTVAPRPLLVFWQPAISGDAVMQQFLRLRVAAQLGAPGEKRETVATLRQQLDAGDTVEVAGYRMSGALFKSVTDISLTRLVAETRQRIHWFHVAPTPPPAANAATALAVAELTRGGATVVTESVTGDAFWSSVEISACEPLLEQTERVIAAFGYE